MAAETNTETLTVKKDEGTPEWKQECPMGDHHIHRNDVRRIWKECQHESLWHRALPLSLGSMAVTGGLIYRGVWRSSKRFGPFPKIAVSGILGFAVGKASYVGTCRSKFAELCLKEGPGSGPWSEGGPGKWKSGPGHRHCHHVCESKKKGETTPAPAEPAQG